MDDLHADLAFADRENRVWADPARGFDYSERRLRRKLEAMQRREREAAERAEALAALADIRTRGVRLRVVDGELRAGPPGLVINGTEAAIRRWRDWLVVLLQEDEVRDT